MRKLLLLFLLAFPAFAQITLVNAGGPVFGDWAASTGFTDGTSFTGNTSDIDDTTDDTLFVTGIEATTSFQWSATVTPGYYRVRLLFAETQGNARGLRRFNITLDSQIIASNLDVFDRAGAAATAYQLQTFVATPLTTLTLAFNRVSGDPFVNAIHVELISQLSSGDTLPSECSEGQTFNLTSATPGQNFHICTDTALGTWTAQAGTSTVATDDVGTDELDDDANTPTAGDFVIVETGAASFDYLTPNAGTDITANLEEESHAAEHQHNGDDEIATATPAANVIPKTGAGSTLAVGFLATGTPDGTKFVRDDGTLAVPAGDGTGTDDQTAAEVSVTPFSTIEATDVQAALEEVLAEAGGGGGGAPTDATYVTQTPNAGLSAEQALSALATGILKNTTTTGVLSIAVGADLPSHTHAIATDVSGLGAGVATFLATPSSANLAAAVTGETGTGAAVFATSPALVTPDLGTPSAAVLTSATGLPITTGVSGLGTGVADFLATPSTANLAAAVTGETGTGAVVFATSPTLVTPNIGVATATSVNGLTISEVGLEALLDLPDLQGQITDLQIADGAIDGGTGGEIADGSITAADLGTDSVSADELNGTGVEAELEAILDLQDLQGTATAAQVVTPLTCTDAGASDTYTCTLSPVPSAASDVKVLWFDPNTDNTGAATLDIGPGSALSIYKAIDGVELLDGDLLANEPVLLKYCAACNSAAGAWLLEGVRGVPRSTLVNIASTSTADSVVKTDGTGKIDSTFFPVQTAAPCFSVLEDPAVGDELAQWIPFAATVVRVQAGTTTGTVTFNIEKRTTLAGAGTDVMSPDLEADNDDQSSCAAGCDDNTIVSGSVSASSWLVLTVSAVSTPGKLTACPVLEFEP